MVDFAIAAQMLNPYIWNVGDWMYLIDVFLAIAK